MINPKNRVTPFALRKQACLTQRQLAEALMVRQGTVSDWERGRSIPHLRPSQVKRLMELLQCSLDDLIDVYESRDRGATPPDHTMFLGAEGLTPEETPDTGDGHYQPRALDP